AARNHEAADLYQRVQNVARGAALMTGCEVDIRFDKACSNLLQNTALNQVLYEEMQRLGPLPVSDSEREQAQRDHATLSENDVAEASRSLGSVLRGQVPALFDGVKDYDPQRVELLYGSTDVADVSWITPTAQCWVACYAFGTPFHSWQMVSQGKSSVAHIGMVRAAKAMAATAIRLLEQPQVLAVAREELQERRAGKPYVCPIPTEVPLPFQRA
ncbi:MAG TPA: amidohydrolase, partial [Methylibium sp.]